MKRICLITVCAAALLFGKTKCSECPYPGFWPVEKVGCEIVEKDQERFVAGGWYVRVHAERDEEKWSALFAIEKDRFKALKDCDEWLTCVTKWQKERGKKASK